MHYCLLQVGLSFVLHLLSDLHENIRGLTFNTKFDCERLNSSLQEKFHDRHVGSGYTP
jgi:hypothetical protein